MKKDSVGYVVLFTFVTCAAFILPLSIANEATKARVKANRLFAAHSSTLRALGISYTDPADAEAKYSSQISELTGVPGFRAVIDDQNYMAVKKSGGGLWGSITMVVAADEKGERLRGIEILDQQETPGLGGRIDEVWFKEQFRGEKVLPEGVRIGAPGSGSGDPDKENGRVDGITGASLTNGFVQKIINDAVADIRATGGSK